MNMESREIICIVCPLGCQMEVSVDDSSKGYTVRGNSCKRGEQYGIKELTNPTRVLTTTVRLKNSLLKRLPVRSDSPIPKDIMFNCMKELNSIEVEAPIKTGDIIVSNIMGTGVNIISTRSI
jgi:CxxC motif-containing protein